MLRTRESADVQHRQSSYLGYIRYLGTAADKVDHDHLMHLLSRADVEEALDRRVTACYPNSSIAVTVKAVASRAALITYLVQLGPFVLKMKMLNVVGKVEKNNKRRIDQNGDTLVLLSTSCKGIEFVCKRIYFSDFTHLLNKDKDGVDWILPFAYSEIENLVIQCAFAKLFSILEIGVQTGSPDHSFDLVCYEDCVEFYMEKCEKAACPNNKKSAHEVEERLKYCLAVMHHFGFIHKDIKPSNILLNSKNELVFADFGISTHVFERPGQKSMAFQEGTHRFMSPEMQSLYNGCGLVDLYFNDAWGLRLSIAFLIKQFPNSQKETQVNELSPILSPFDTLIMQLFERLSGKSETISNFLIESSFGLYFRELKEEVAYTEFDIEFLIRSVGIAPVLLRHLEIATNLDHRARILLENLQKQFGSHKDDQTPALRMVRQLRRGFERAVQRLEQGAEEERAERLALVLRFANKLVNYFNFYLQFEQSLIILERVSPYLTQSQSESLVFKKKLFNEKVTVQDFEKASDYTNQECSELLSLALLSFRRRNYTLSHYIICKLFHQPNESPSSAKSIVQYLRKILYLEIPQSLKDQILLFLHAGYFGCDYLEVSTLVCSENQKCQQRKKLYEIYNAQVSTNMGSHREAAKWYGEAESTSRMINGGQTEQSIQLTFLRCRTLEVFSNSDEIRTISERAFKTLLQLAPQNRDLILKAYIFLADTEFKAKNFSRCFDFIEKGLSLASDTHNSSKARSSFVHIFLKPFFHLVYPNPCQARLVKIVKSIQNYFRQPEWKLQQNQAKRLEALLYISNLYGLIGVEDTAFSVIQEINGLANTENSSKIILTLNNCLRVKKRLNKEKGLRIADLFDELLTRFPLQQPIELLKFREGFVSLGVLGRTDTAKKWINKIVQISEAQATISYPELQQSTANDLLLYGYYEEAYRLAKPLIRQNGSGTYVAARCMQQLGRVDESIQLFHRYLAKGKVSNNDRSITEQICSSHFNLSVQYRKQAKQQLAQLHARHFFSSCGRLVYDGIAEEMGSLKNTVALFMPNYKAREVVACRKRLVEIARDNSVVPELASMAFCMRDYQLALGSLSKAKQVNCSQTVLLKEQLAVAQSHIILGRAKGFYQSAKRLITMCQNGSHAHKLWVYLRQRREYVKLYIVYEERTPGYTQFETVLDMMSQGLGKNYHQTSTKRRLGHLSFMKRILRQCGYSRHYFKDTYARILLLIKQMKAMF